MAVADERTEKSLSDWVEEVLEQDDMSEIDNSLYPEQHSIDGEDYIYESLSCGCLHDTISCVTNEFDALISLHLKDTAASIKKAEKIMASIRHDNVEEKVIELTINIVDNER